ncbi:nucleotide pyrophosphohydrolase [Mesoterricola silvestris]|uniref:Nucleotide pyrophosphohydrolase n=1 Tax=Mesoterricola silvestris TaxID=2927979 RepID=A0AA48KBB5_9BACT|nr:nucleotide pyrophosphohydrolase [Mesoterricola silvestris]BDU74167.1 nucleotide pyrophosphohydrolase [Mesoterricola silvestris]
MEKSLIDEILRFRDARNWKQFHNPKDLAISLSIEASELLECFQWASSAEALASRREQIAEELADVMIYAALLAEATGLDLEAITRAKLAVNAEKYPVEKAYGRKDKYDRL